MPTPWTASLPSGNAARLVGWDSESGTGLGADARRHPRRRAVGRACEVAADAGRSCLAPKRCRTERARSPREPASRASGEPEDTARENTVTELGASLSARTRPGWERTREVTRGGELSSERARTTTMSQRGLRPEAVSDRASTFAARACERGDRRAGRHRKGKHREDGSIPEAEGVAAVVSAVGGLGGEHLVQVQPAFFESEAGAGHVDAPDARGGQAGLADAEVPVRFEVA